MTSYDPTVCVIGGGFSGICAGIKLQNELNFKNFTIYDENDDFGGIWLTHTYPGCACDVPSIMYSFSFELNPDWSTTYARQPEILDYLKKVAKKYELYSKAKFFHKIESATWDNTTKDWKVVVQDLRRNKVEEIRYDFVIYGTGPFRTPNIPEKFLSFKGPVIHSAKWDASVSLKDKVVGVVGSGASAVQIIPQIMPNVKKLVSFQRNPAWVPPHHLYEIPPLVKQAYRNIPFLMRLVRILVFLVFDTVFFAAFKAKGIMVDMAIKFAKWNMFKDLKDPEMRAKLTPGYRFGCKRVTPSNGYFKALSQPNCEVTLSDIAKVGSNSIVTSDGKEFELDVLILATGYHIQDFWLPMSVKGISGEDALKCLINNESKHYLGVVSSEMPNSFILLGPNSGYGHNSVVFSIECQMNWVVNVLKEMRRRGSRYVQVKEDAEISYRQIINEKTKSLVWGAYTCSSWYFTDSGVNLVIYPGNLISYWSRIRTVDFNKLILQ